MQGPCRTIRVNSSKRNQQNQSEVWLIITAALIRRILKSRGNLPDPLWQALMRVGWGVFWTWETIKQSLQQGKLLTRVHYTERATFIEILCKHLPFNSGLEVGSAYGQGFALMGKLFPEVRFFGIEIDRDRVKYGQEVLLQKGIKNVELIQGSGADLSQFSDASIDIVFSSAALLYISDQEISSVIKEMIRVCRKSLILVELHHPNPYFQDQDRGVFLPRENGIGGFWLRDYQKLIKKVLPRAEVKITKIKFPIWDTEPWTDFGNIIEVDLI